uniref:Protein kinase domain-containing protein n=1 Tax=Daucus carota subsp. sativus TaxID=79200 RepID=A0A175YHK6_DAUCS
MIYRFKDLKSATRNFSESSKIGEGGSGDVYKGIIKNGDVVAVKKLSIVAGKGKPDFKSELKLISIVNHRNIIRLLGYAVRGSELLLVCEYMANRSLDKFLYGEFPNTKHRVSFNIHCQPFDMWIFGCKGNSGFSARSTAEEVTQGIDGAGLTAIVTGASNGIGTETTRVLALRGVHVVMAVRNVASGTRVKEEILKEIPRGRLTVMEIDLNSLASVRKFAREYIASGLPLNILINNAGVMAPPFTLSKDNIEQQFAVNHLGASNGIGTETTRVLALRGVHVVMAVRNVASGTRVKEEILKEIPRGRLTVMEIDLNSLASVRKFAREYIASGLPLNILINNAGVMAPPFTLSKDNIEQQFAVNHLGPFLLTNLLLETMKSTARKTQKEGRIVNVSSALHQNGYKEGIRFEKINDKASYNGNAAYGQSKLCNLLHTNELARRFKTYNPSESSVIFTKREGVNITANSLHPGIIATNLTNNLGLTGWVLNTFGKYLLKNVPQGAATTCYVALHPQVKGQSGEYFMDSNKAEANATSSLAKDPVLASKLWDFSLTMTNGK